MEFQEVEQNGKVLITYTLETDKEIDMLVQGMLLNNKIQGVLSVEVTGKDGYLEYSSEITDLHKVSDIYGKVLRKQGLLAIFISMAETVINARSYMIPEEYFVFDPNYVFLNMLNGQVSMICLPLNQSDCENTMKSAFSEILDKITTDSREPDDYVEYLKEYIKQDKFSVDSILDLMRRLLRNEIVIPKKPDSMTNQSEIRWTNRDAHCRVIQSDAQEQKEKSIRTLSSVKAEIEKNKTDFKIRSLTDVRDEMGKDSDEKTVNVSFDQQKEDSHLEAGCLSESKEELTYRDTELFRESEDDDSSKLDGARYYLIRLSTKERISIIGREFVIGRSAEQADYAIKDNIWISNIHASILKTNEGCFIRDLGSLNHTYLNDTLIEVRTEKLIPNGAIIRMGNERFQFECVGALNG